MAKLEHIVVVGASLAGFRAIEALRREGFEGRLTALGAEPHRPYDRPPLSKQYLTGKWDEEKVRLRPVSADDLGVEWRLGRRAVSLDAKAQRLTLDDGESIDYDGLLIATGASARTLPGSLLADGARPAGIHVLRGLDDASALREALAGEPRVVVIGAGFIGMEVAASCREIDCDVTVVEALPTPLVRGLGPKLGEYVADVFRDQGVAIHCGSAVARIEGVERVEAAVLEDGTRLPADVIVVGIGAVPETRWLEGSGLELDNGVLCDETCAASVPNVVAAGDVARWLDVRSGERLRAEHWTNAVEQSAHAARRLLHGPEVGPYRVVPYVWSDQFHLRIQIAGEVGPDDEMHVCHGTLEEGRFVALFGHDGKLTAAVGFKRPRQLLGFRDALAAGAGWRETLDALPEAGS